MKKQKHITTLHVRNMPPDLKARFKAYCAKRGYSMEAAVRQLMRDAVRLDRRLDMPVSERHTQGRKPAD